MCWFCRRLFAEPKYVLLTKCSIELMFDAFLHIIIITQVLLATHLNWIDITIGYN